MDASVTDRPFGMPVTSHVVVELPGQPKGKGRPRSRIIKPRAGAQFVSVYTPAETRSYEAELKHMAAIEMRGRPPIDGPLRVDVTAFFGVPASWSRKKQLAALNQSIRPTGKPDWENIAKMLDAFNGLVWRDDSQIVTGLISKRYSDRPRLRIEVEGL